MGGFEEHLKWGKAAAIVGAIVVYLAIDDLWLAVGASALILTGSLLPDIDHHASIPRRMLGDVSTLVALIGIIAAAAFLPETVASIGGLVALFGIPGDPFVLGIVAIGAGVFIMSKIGGPVFDSLLTHRGITHSGTFALLSMGIVTVLALYVFSLDGAVVLGTAIAVGIIVHLMVDR